MSNYGGFNDYDYPDFPDYDPPEPEESQPLGAYVNGEWRDVEDLPIGYGNSPDWWDDDCGETFEEYMEHED